MDDGIDDGRPNRLGDYLRARRRLVLPATVGLPADGHRRVPGLRREELALLAGISSDYYLRLEQGRNRRPSAQVLTSLARVLQLDQSGTDYLLELGGALPPSRRSRDAIVPRIADLVGSMTLPAFVVGRYADILVSNSPAVALSPLLRAGENLLRAVFLDAGRDLGFAADDMVAMFRRRVGGGLGDPRVVELVGELSASARFREAWARHDVQPIRGGPVHLHHPQIGPVVLNLSKLAVDEADDQTLVVYHPAASHPDSADRLEQLTSLAAERVAPRTG